jgi:hypothetical protein
MSSFASREPAFIYTTLTNGGSVKFIYCPRCKELRVKPWYSLRAWCSRCRDEGREIRVPKSILTYILYAMILVVFAFVYMYTDSRSAVHLIGAVVGLVASFVIQAVELSRGEKQARARIKTTKADAAASRSKGRGL